MICAWAERANDALREWPMREREAPAACDEPGTFQGRHQVCLSLAPGFPRSFFIATNRGEGTDVEHLTRAGLRVGGDEFRGARYVQFRDCGERPFSDTRHFAVRRALALPLAELAGSLPGQIGLAL